MAEIGMSRAHVPQRHGFNILANCNKAATSTQKEHTSTAFIQFLYLLDLSVTAESDGIT